MQFVLMCVSYADTWYPNGTVSSPNTAVEGSPNAGSYQPVSLLKTRASEVFISRAGQCIGHDTLCMVECGKTALKCCCLYCRCGMHGSGLCSRWWVRCQCLVGQGEAQCLLHAISTAAAVITRHRQQTPLCEGGSAGLKVAYRYSVQIDAVLQVSVKIGLLQH